MQFASILNRRQRSPQLSEGVEVFYLEGEESDTDFLIHMLKFLSTYQTEKSLSARTMPILMVNDNRSSIKGVLAAFLSQPPGALTISGIIGMQFHNRHQAIFRAYLERTREEQAKMEASFEDIDEDGVFDSKTLHEFFDMLKGYYFPDRERMN
jgi:hypothetical protein